MKKEKKKDFHFSPIIFWVVIYGLTIGICLFLGYIIATSDLPDWMKFFLLS